MVNCGYKDGYQEHLVTKAAKAHLQLEHQVIEETEEATTAAMAYRNRGMAAESTRFACFSGTSAVHFEHFSFGRYSCHCIRHPRRIGGSFKTGEVAAGGGICVQQPKCVECVWNVLVFLHLSAVSQASLELGWGKQSTLLFSGWELDRASQSTPPCNLRQESRLTTRTVD